MSKFQSWYLKILFTIVIIAGSQSSSLFAAERPKLDYDREKNWADQILPMVVVGDPVWLEQENGHKFLGLYTEAEQPRGAIIVAHGRGWNPDFELYGTLRVLLADAGYTTLSIQLPVLGGGAKVGDYIPTYPEAGERFDLAAEFLREKGFENIAMCRTVLGRRWQTNI